MWFDNRNKTRLKELQDRATRLREGSPPYLQALRQELDLLIHEIQAGSKRFLRTVSASELQGFEGRLAGLEQRAVWLEGYRVAAKPVLQAEVAHHDDLQRLDSPELREAFRRRSDERKACIPELAQKGPAHPYNEALQRLDRAREVDRRLATRFLSAQERLRRIASDPRASHLKQALPSLEQRFIDSGPSPELLADLEGLLGAVQKHPDRERPQGIEQAFGLLRQIEKWMRVLYDPAELRTAGTEGARRQAEFQAIHEDYLRIGKDWRNHDDATVHGLLERTEQLTNALLDRAQTERDESRRQLERNREIFLQFGEPDLSPGLADEITELLDQDPQGPYEHREWRDRFRSATQRFTDALGGDLHHILERIRDQVTAVDATLTRLGSMPLDRPHAGSVGTLGGDLATMPPLPEDDATDAIPIAIDLLDRYVRLAADLERVYADASAKWQERKEIQATLKTRAQRLVAIAEASGLTPSETLIAWGQSSDQRFTSLEELDRFLAERRESLREVEGPLVDACCQRISHRLAGLGAIHEFLDPDLIPKTLPLPALRLDERPRTLEAAEALIPHLPAMHEHLEQALQQQIARLQERRGQLLLPPGLSLDAGPPSGDQSVLMSLLVPLRDLDEGRLADPYQLARELRRLIGQVDQHTRLVGKAEGELEDMRRRLHDRWVAWSGEFPELAQSPHHGRVGALIKLVPGVHTSRESREQQLRKANELLRALERHARRQIAHRFATDLGVIRQRGIQVGHGSTLAAWLNAHGHHLKLPEYQVREQARQLVEQMNQTRGH